MSTFEPVVLNRLFVIKVIHQSLVPSNQGVK